jgi:hypothetical protein
MSLNGMTIDELCNYCKESTQQFLNRLPHDDQYCFELLRRALAEQQQDALYNVYEIYLPLAVYWAETHPRFLQTRYPADEFATIGMSNFCLALGGEKFQRFDGLPSIMKFLKACVSSEIALHLRKISRIDPILSEDIADLQNQDVSISERIWQRISELLPDSVDRILVDCVFRQDLKPAEITSLYGQYCSSAREVSVALQRLRRTLRRDPLLTELLRL